MKPRLKWGQFFRIVFYIVLLVALYSVAGLELRASPASRNRRESLTQRLKDLGNGIRNGFDRVFPRGTTDPSGPNQGPLKVIHIPHLYIDPEKDGFLDPFYGDLISAAVCLTSQPELDLHDPPQEYEAVLCQRKAYGRVIPPSPPRKHERSKSLLDDQGQGQPQIRSKRSNETWEMPRTKLDTLWKVGDHNEGSTTIRPIIITGDPPPGSGSGDEEYIFDYGGGPSSEDEDDEFTGPLGREIDDFVEDPTDLDYMRWPPYLPEGTLIEDDIRSKTHTHTREGQLNRTASQIQAQARSEASPIPFERRHFGLNESSYLTSFYNYNLNLTLYQFTPIIQNFFSTPNSTLSQFQTITPIDLSSLRQLYILFILNIHHVNAFNRHIRFYGYIGTRPSGITGDEISNGARLARGIVMRGLELIRHVPAYNAHKNLFLRLLIAGLKEMASAGKAATAGATKSNAAAWARRLIEENDYAELYEVASYVENLLERGIHPDELDQDLFVEETRFYSHHFMNTLTL